MAGDNKGKFLRDAEKYVTQGKLTQAITEYLKIIKTDPNDVLTLNTVGDLYLRLGKVSDARKYFSQVADHYARNNFLLKAIAVYRKILSADPDNTEVNLTLASLYVKQGLTVEARNQYLRVAELHSAAGKTRECLECFEKVVELDPKNSAVQLRLGEIYLADGNKEKAHSYFAGAAQAQAKAGDFRSAIDSFKRAAQLNPVNIEAMKGFLEASVQVGDMSAVMEQLKKSLVMAHDSVPLQEMMGQACLAMADPENAAKVFQAVISQDESLYPHMLRVSKAFLEAGDADQAACCLDSVVPIMISRRETERGVEAYNLILKGNPQHALTLTRLAALHSATNNVPKYVETLEKVVAYYLSRQSPMEAFEYIQKILQIEPENEKYLAMHRQVFAEAFPGKPYPQVAASEKSGVSTEVPQSPASASPPADNTSAPGFVDIDLLVTYGMSDQALERLRTLETEDPWNQEVRCRLLSLYKDLKQFPKAAEQCLMLAALQRKDDDDASAQKSLAEAKKLAPDLVGPGFDLDAFAQRQGIVIAKAVPAKQDGAPERVPGIELDLSGDLSEIFFRDSSEPETAEQAETEPAGGSESAEEAGVLTFSASIEEQLQEVDFYIRLGFHEEARAKLDAISKDHPNNPELAVRYRMLPSPEAASAVASQAAAGATPNADETRPPKEEDAFQELRIEQAIDRVVEDYSSESRDRQPLAGEAESESLPAMNVLSAEAGKTLPGAATPAPGEAQLNNMFSDLIDEVNLLTDQEIAREELETHFNLGIAYREMGLLEEAIKEFQGAVKGIDPAKFAKEVIQCCGMLSTCFLDKGMPRSAIRWCQAGLSVSEISSHEAMALRYDMGVAHSALGEKERALECYDFIFGTDPSYRDVAQKIDRLRSGSEPHGT